MIILTITLELKMILQTIRRDVDNVLINIDPSNVFLYMFFPGRFHQYSQTASGCCER